MVQAVCEQPALDDGCVRQHFPLEGQKRFGEAVITNMGFDFNRGRQDLTHHPFMIRFHGNDVRITTRYDENNLSKGLFGTIHEAGHALYELGVAEELDGTLLGQGTSYGMHESQSRLWENLVARSMPFWTYYYPRLQAEFPHQLSEVPLQRFYAAINRVSRSLVRTEADELTYNLHVMVRFELELELLEGRLAVKDLPERWAHGYISKLGIRPPTDRDGVLQDVHWYSDLVGGSFQSYALGNVISAQLFEAALAAHPEIPGEIAQGNLKTLLQWLRRNVHQPGKSISAMTLVERATGKPLDMEPYMRMLRNKYSGLYRM
jgi:carboxypeptidase Taq